ncbi:sodium channel subunit beta-2 isoform X1 [Peromyscus californicus insignis]|uniref:sodium channel subunit beta-2 isoform X1 n=1 Tax=Peromyscus californicus insignis TaxID=564181 RepID=UPI0022A6DEC2|nr:sodium channel subunit beta-2 isoform X1 [Peromyscus californicus insignis]
MHRDAWLPRPAFSLTGLSLFFTLGQGRGTSVLESLESHGGMEPAGNVAVVGHLGAAPGCQNLALKTAGSHWSLGVPPGRSMEVTVPTTLSVLNGSDTRLPCTFNSCYTVNHKQFSLNWTYQECSNCSEEMFLQFRMKIINLKLERFGDRVEFSGNPSKYDVSVTLKNVQLEDEGIYNCYITNPPDRHRGHGKIYLQVLLEVPPERDSTVAVIVGASVGGFLAVVILVLMVVKCVRRKKEQKLNTDDLKTEEEGKTDGEGNVDDSAK